MCRTLERKTHEAFIESHFKILLALVMWIQCKDFNFSDTVKIRCSDSVHSQRTHPKCEGAAVGCIYFMSVNS